MRKEKNPKESAPGRPFILARFAFSRDGQSRSRLHCPFAPSMAQPSDQRSIGLYCKSCSAQAGRTGVGSLRLVSVRIPNFPLGHAESGRLEKRFSEPLFERGHAEHSASLRSKCFLGLHEGTGRSPAWTRGAFLWVLSCCHKKVHRLPGRNPALEIKKF